MTITTALRVIQTLLFIQQFYVFILVLVAEIGVLQGIALVQQDGGDNHKDPSHPPHGDPDAAAAAALAQRRFSTRLSCVRCRWNACVIPSSCVAAIRVRSPTDTSTIDHRCVAPS